jgi:PAS domain S-box-containing protein
MSGSPSRPEPNEADESTPLADLSDLTDHPLWSGMADGLAVVDGDGVLLAVNEPFERLFGYDDGELTGQSVDVLVPSPSRSGHAELRARYAANPHVRTMGASRLLEGKRRDGDLFPLNISLSPITVDGARLTLAAVRDLTDRIEVEADRAREQRLRAIADDHDRIARDLHDSVIQHLFAVGLRLQGLPGRVDDPAVSQTVTESVDAIDAVIAQIRQTIHGLRPPPATSSPRSLQAGVLSVIAEMEEVLPSSPSISFEGAIGDVDPAVLTNLLPTVREALANVAHHARASTVAIAVTVGDDVTVEVVDDGVGLAPGQRRSGLANLEARAKALGGAMTTEANEPTGLRLTWRVPNPG